MNPTLSRLVHDPEGLNTGTPRSVAATHLITPTDHFFTRSHAAVPAIDPAGWRLEIGGLVRGPGELSLEQLMTRFPRREVTATLVCAGLRRVEFLALGPLPGELPWGPDAASTGRWGGVALADVLRSVDLAPAASHVELVGLDVVERHGRRFGFGGSIPLAKALNPEVLLAFELNGAPLPAVHGFPLRLVVPGWIGARSVKWLGRIQVRDHPSDNYFQTQAYRVQREVNPAAPRDVSAGTAMAGLPINAVILVPEPESRVPPGPLAVRGWAMGSEASPVRRVELSADDGASWQPARVTPSGPWTWSHWDASIDLAPGRHTIVVRAADERGDRQPKELRDAWNVKGYGNNAWHRVAVFCTATQE